jgi:hypothetical protein
VATSTLTPDQVLEEVRAKVPALVEFAARGLPQMFDKQKGLFCYRMQKTSQGLVLEGTSPRYTLITLLGLERFAAAGGEFPLDTRAILCSLLSRTEWINNIGDLGLVLWACAKILPGGVEEICSRQDLNGAPARFDDGREAKTTELSWFLTGLSYAVLMGAKQSAQLAELAAGIYRLVKNNQGDYGIFGHQARGSRLTGNMRARIGAFADQVYPIYAFTQYAKAFGVCEALTNAVQCGEAICRAQGTLGQWWWHYDAVTGDVIGKYPVFSVHQDGMAPMALFALSEAANTDFSPSIYKGLRWIYGANELNYEFRDLDTKVIWRCIDARRYDRYWRPIVALLGLREMVRQPNELAVVFESRPYESGWLLYAFTPFGLGDPKGRSSRSGQTHR